MCPEVSISSTKEVLLYANPNSYPIPTTRTAQLLIHSLMSSSETSQPVQRNVAPRPGAVRVFRPSSAAAGAAAKRNAIPDSLMQNEALKTAIKLLPENYNFEIYKTIWRIQSEGYRLVALQFPEGLLMYACTIADIIEKFCKSKVIILSDVTYGACCIDDLTAHKLGADFLVHYGHSCLVSTNTTCIKTLYVFVEMYFDTSHLLKSLAAAFPKGGASTSTSTSSSSSTSLEAEVGTEAEGQGLGQEGAGPRFALMGTIQFNSAVHQVATTLKEQGYNIVVPQEKPLSSGEALGCTAPVLPTDCTDLVFVADGRFHLEAAMIRNPQVRALRYDPYSKVLSREGYDTERMKADRWSVIQRSRSGQTYGLILGTLGRQGNRALFDRLRARLEARGKTVVRFLMAEISPVKLQLFPSIDVWVQVACPRLSIDWGTGFSKPLLTPYEALVSLQEAAWAEVYPMDYYGHSAGDWGNNPNPKQQQPKNK